VTGQRFPNRPEHSSSRYVVNLMRDDRLRLEAIVADRSAPQNMYGAPSTFSPRPPVAAPPRSCAAASNRAGSKAMAGAIMPRVSWADARQEAHCRQEAAASPPFSGSSIWRLGCVGVPLNSGTPPMARTLPSNITWRATDSIAADLVSRQARVIAASIRGPAWMGSKCCNDRRLAFALIP
jgi:hypothetical protein